MKKSLLFLLPALLWVCMGNAAETVANTEKGFREVPSDIRLATYWYWISDNISEEGMIRDLEAMKKVGITRAFIGNIGLSGQNGIPFGKVKVLSNEWWKILHTALKTASKLDIEIGIFNSPGWSQSGGPWIKPEQSMRYLASEEYVPTGKDLWKPQGEMEAKSDQDVKVIAWKKLSAPPSGFTAKQVDDKVMLLNSPKPDSVRTMILRIKNKEVIHVPAALHVKEGGEWRLLSRFTVDRSNYRIEVGFYPDAPVVISIPATYASEFRLTFGNGGTDKIESVELSALPLTERWPEKSLAKMFQRPLPMWGDYMWSAQPEIGKKELMIDPAGVRDISGCLQSDGSIKWKAPSDGWTVQRMRMKSTGVTNHPASPEATGLEVDKMSKKHAAAHFDAFIGEILRRIPAEDRRTFKVVVQDSYETGGQNWTDGMIGYFKDRYGYDPIPFLPALQGNVVGNPDLSDRFLWDLRRLVADKVAYDYVAGLREVSHKHGLTTWLENYGHWGFPSEFLMYGGQSDEIGGEFWSTGSLGDIENRAASSCGHIYGKNRIWAESFTYGGIPFYNHPFTMKQRGDRFFAEGINATLLHVYIHQPYEDKRPGMNAWFGNEFNRFNTWFDQSVVFNDYLRRCNFVLQQGRYVADLAYFIGEDAPKMTGVCDPALPAGRQFDYINGEVILKYASVKNGKLCLVSGMEYEVLVLPRQVTMRPEVAEKIASLVREGLTIVGPAPERSPSMEGYPECDRRVKAVAAELWKGIPAEGGSAAVGKGRVYNGVGLEKIFEDKALVPDFVQPGDQLHFLRRTLADGEVYFIANTKADRFAGEVTFRVGKGRPELWDAVTGEVRSLKGYTRRNGTTSIELELENIQSVFVVFRGNDTQEGKGVNFPVPKTEIALDGAWEVTFGQQQGAPRVTFNKLSDWIANDDPAIKYFSGTAVYEKRFVLNEVPAGRVYLDLGNVVAMASVTINGAPAGGVWTYPYRVAADGLLKKGENTLRIEVVNNWLNKLIGENPLPQNERTTWVPGPRPAPNVTLQSSGLLGPVKVRAYEY